MLEFWPSTLNPACVRLIIRSSFVEMDGFREAFPEAGVLNRHLN